MSIRGLGVISDAVLELGPGLTVVTGETGAGKTMVVTGLGLLLGARADAGAVRTGTDAAVVEGRFVVGAGSSVAERAAEAGAELDDDVLIVVRSVAAGGRSRAHLGGRSVPVGVLGEIADDLVAVHGQSEQVLLRSPGRQREAVDAFAGEPVTVPLRAYADAWTRWREVGAQLEEVVGHARERRAEAERLRHDLEEVEHVDPQAGEDVDLAAEAERLSHAEDLRAAATVAHSALVGDELDPTGAPDVSALLEGARRSLDAAGEHDPALASLAGRLAEAGFGVTDVALELSGYLQSLEADPARLQVVQERRSELAGLTRKHSGDVDAVLTWTARAAQRLVELEGDDDRVGALEAERAELGPRLEDLSAQLHGARVAAAARLGAAATTELADLAMPHAVLDVEVRRTDTLGPHGSDEVTLLLTPHAGAPARAIARGASGGELSRVMLALEVTLAGTDPVPTFVFDEVDAGVGGRAAVEIGRRLAALATSSQVLVVTHLPQVAAFADRHLVVVKADDGRVTESGVQALDDGGRVRELARMLAGQEDSETAQAHAAELLASARRP